MVRVWVFYSPGNFPIYIIYLKKPGKKELKGLHDKKPITAILPRKLFDKVRAVLKKNKVRKQSIALGEHSFPDKVMIPGPIGVSKEFTQEEIKKFEELAGLRELAGIDDSLKRMR
ncbi:MAG: hypothetical protein JRN68_06555 [Nitrososphaerota archaeon]|nr:hypothetical protein [Nitrososphaerota archaeon]